MASIHEVRKGEDQIQFALAALGEDRLQPRKIARERGRAAAEAAMAPHQLNLDGMRLLIGMAFCVGLVGMFLWGFIRHWLFAP